MRAVVTGGAGYIGSQLIKLLAREPRISEIVVLDVAPLRSLVEKTRLVRRSVTDDLTDVIADPARPTDLVVHLAWIVDPLRDAERQREICIGGTRRVLDACAKGKVRQLLFMSSATAYGANPDHAELLREFDPLREQYHFQYSREKREAELLCRRFAADHPAITLQVVRPAIVGGPNVSNFLFRSLHRPLVMSPLGHAPELQLVHEEDVARAVATVLLSGVPGAFNVAGEGTLTLEDCLHLLGRRALPLPFSLLRVASAALWHLEVRSMVEAPPGFLYFLRYPWRVSTERIRSELGFQFRYTARQVLESYLRGRRGGRTWNADEAQAAEDAQTPETATADPVEVAG